MKQRLDFVTLAIALNDGRFAELCRRFAISRKTGYKWLNRFRLLGEAGLADRSRKPRRHPSFTLPQIEQIILNERHAHPGNGPRKLRRRLLNKGHAGLPASSTFARILKRNALIDPVISQQHTPFIRFERPLPNQLWQMDFKGHFPLGSGGRCHPLTIIDDHSRFLICLHACPDQTTRTVQELLTNAFIRYGLPDQILCDNGPPWGSPSSDLTLLSFWLLRQGIQVLHGRPRHPQTQGKDERFHRTLKDELLTRHDWPDLSKTQQRFEIFREDYNHHRPHHALELNVPASRYRVSPRSFTHENPPIQYAPDELTRTVRSGGQITLNNHTYYIGRALATQTVVLRPHKREDHYTVCIGSIPLGLIDLNAPADQSKHHHNPLLPLNQPT